MTEIRRTFDIIDYINEQYSQKNDVFGGKRNGVWFIYSASDYRQYVNAISYSLLELGFKKGDHILSVSTNKPEWNFMDMALAQLGIVHIPVYPNINTEEYIYIFNHSDAKAIFVGDDVIYQRIKSAIDATPSINKVFCLWKNECLHDSNIYSLIEKGRQLKEKYQSTLEEIKKSIHPDDIATIIYTSGTTGTSKGVMLRHSNLVSNIVSSSKIQPLNSKHKVLSFLPLCHIFERMLNYHYQYLGISIFYAENIGTIAENLREIKVHGMTTVPRLLESIFDKIQAKGKDTGGIKKKIFNWAVNVALAYDLNPGIAYRIKQFIATILVYNKIKQSLGGNLKIIISGGAALQVRLHRFFGAMGIQVLEGYGLTETSPVISVNYPKGNNIRFGTVGPLLENVEVKIAEDGEILVKGPNVMKGYYKDEEATKTAIDSEGWFHTGDIGEMIENKFLKITDRKKEIFKNAGGKYIAPQVIENKLKESIFIEQAMVIGENEKFAAAIISPNFNHLHFWAVKHKVHYSNNKELIQNSLVIDRINEEVQKTNESLSPHEQIKKIRLVPETWSTQTGELSPTLKLKRKVIYEKYKHIMCEIYKC
ncbi:MAG TPA: long-chain fatty acid--CoA ligase [Bacteroidales bacterium]|nr:long-chain fatty acid--CoA ligase [Bacteroidales bacterium]